MGGASSIFASVASGMIQKGPEIQKAPGYRIESVGRTQRRNMRHVVLSDGLLANPFDVTSVGVGCSSTTSPSLCLHIPCRASPGPHSGLYFSDSPCSRADPSLGLLFVKPQHAEPPPSTQANLRSVSILRSSTKVMLSTFEPGSSIKKDSSSASSRAPGTLARNFVEKRLGSRLPPPPTTVLANLVFVRSSDGCPALASKSDMSTENDIESSGNAVGAAGITHPLPALPLTAALVPNATTDTGTDTMGDAGRSIGNAWQDG